jgi:putative membrane protein
MLVRVLFQWGLTALAFGITSWLLPGMTVNGGIGAYLWVSLLFGAVNVVVGTILRLLTLPLIADALTSHLDIDDFFWTAIWASIILSLVSVTINFFIWLARSED